jgi:probable HAF family extracellular repeat protein
MWFTSSLRDLISGSTLAHAGHARRQTARTRPASRRLYLEQLEDRLCPSGYAITDLAIAGAAHAINNSGQVAGAILVSGHNHASLYNNGVQTDLGTLPGDVASQAYALNDSGNVVGMSVGMGPLSQHGFLWTPTTANGTTGTMIQLGNTGGYNPGYFHVNAVNNLVQVVGDESAGTAHAWLWQNGVMTDINSLLSPADQSAWVLQSATGINDSQQVVGRGTHNGTYTTFLWQISTNVLTDLGVTSYFGPSNYATPAINKIGQVAGAGQVAANDFLWTPNQPNGLTGTITLLGGGLSPSSKSEVYTMNTPVAPSLVQVVGYSVEYTKTGSNAHAVLWQSGKVIDLTKQIPSNAGWSQLLVASGVNDGGWIVGWGTLKTGVIHTFLLTPTASTLVVSGPTSVTAGVAFSFTITALDASGNVATGYTGTVHMTSTDTSAKLPPNYTFTASNAGVHTFTGVVLKTKGNQTITLIDTLFSSLTASITVDVL